MFCVYHLTLLFVLLHQSEPFMTLIADKPDAYGPVWVSTLLVFSLAVTSHISSWVAAQSNGNQW
jgi:hypothetical protein